MGRTVRVRISVNWRQLTPGLRPVIESLRSRILDELKEAVEDAAPSGVRVRRTPLADVVAEDPAAAIEFGTRPGYFPNIRRIAAWAVSRGKLEAQAPWRIARAIMRRGTPPRPFVFPAIERLPLDRILTDQWRRFFRVGLRR